MPTVWGAENSSDIWGRTTYIDDKMILKAGAFSGSAMLCQPSGCGVRVRWIMDVSGE